MFFHKHSSGCLGRKGLLQGHLQHRFLKFLRSGIAAARRVVFYHTNRRKSPNQSSALTVCTEHKLSKWTLQTQGEKKKKAINKKQNLRHIRAPPASQKVGGGGRGMSISTDMKFEDREVLSLKITWFLAKTLSRCMPPFFERLLELGLDFRDK